MQMKHFWLPVLALNVAVFAFGADKSIECHAHGKVVSNNGGGLVNGTANFTFTETSKDGLRVLKNVEGRFSSANGVGDTEEDYIGTFKIKSLAENPKYKPRRYVGFSQFPKFDATDTDSSQEPGMWGQLVLEKDTDQATFAAHYIFQAGDHMGGTLHLSCTTK